MPPSAPCAIPVRVTLPVLVRVNAWVGSRPQAITPKPVPGQFRVWRTVQLVGVRVALTTAATPVPLSATGEPVTGTLPVMVTVPFARPGGAVGENVTRMVQLAFAAKVAPQVPPA